MENVARIIRVVYGVIRCVVKSGLGALCDNFLYINEWKAIVPTEVIVPVVLGVSTKKEQSAFQYYVQHD